MVGALSREASAQDSTRPVSVQRTLEAERVERHDVPKETPREPLAVSRGVAVTLYAPHLDTLLAELDALVLFFGAVDPTVANKRFGEAAAEAVFTILPEALALPAHGPGPKAPTHSLLAHLLTPAGLTAAGVEPRASATIIPSLTDDAFVVRVRLSSRKSFEQLLERLAEHPPLRTPLDREHVTVIGPASELPIACLVRRDDAWCQIGASSGKDAIALLRSVLDGNDTLEQTSGMGRAFGALRDDAIVYALFETKSLAHLIAEETIAHAERTHRFDTPEARRSALRRAQVIAHFLKRRAPLLEGAAAGVYRRPGSVEVDAELVLAPQARPTLEALVPGMRHDELLRKWAETPALGRIVARLHTRHVERLARFFDLPTAHLAPNGTVAALFLGLDAEAACAKKRVHPGHADWLFLFPSAFAIGLEDGTGAAIAREPLVGAFERAGVAPKTAESEGALRQDATTVRGTAKSGALEVHVRPDVVLVGTGLGSGSAALRRWNNTAPPEPRHGPPWIEGREFLNAAVRLRAIDAAFAAGSFTRHHRLELLALEALRLRFKPLLDRMDTVELSAQALPDARRVHLELRVGP